MLLLLKLAVDVQNLAAMLLHIRVAEKYSLRFSVKFAQNCNHV